MKMAMMLCHCIVVTCSNLCMREEELVCCPGFVMNATEKQCIPCKDGFYAFGCRLSCPFPYFGAGCLQKCNCGSKQCHHIYGCINEYTTMSTTLPMEKNTTDLNETSSPIPNHNIDENQSSITDNVLIISMITIGVVLVSTSTIVIFLIIKKC